MPVMDFTGPRAPLLHYSQFSLTRRGSNPYEISLARLTVEADTIPGTCHCLKKKRVEELSLLDPFSVCIPFRLSTGKANPRASFLVLILIILLIGPYCFHDYYMSIYLFVSKIVPKNHHKRVGWFSVFAQHAPSASRLATTCGRRPIHVPPRSGLGAVQRILTSIFIPYRLGISMCYHLNTTDRTAFVQQI